jgi:hypothetical protein
MATEQLVNLKSHLTSGFNIQRTANPGKEGAEPAAVTQVGHCSTTRPTRSWP